MVQTSSMKQMISILPYDRAIGFRSFGGLFYSLIFRTRHRGAQTDLIVRQGVQLDCSAGLGRFNHGFR